MQFTQPSKPQVTWQDQANKAPMSGITVVRPIDQFLSPMKSILGQTSPNMALKAAEFEKDLRTERDNAIDASRRTQIAQQEADTDRWYKEQSLLAKYISGSNGNGYGSSGSSSNPSALSWTDQNRAWDERNKLANYSFSTANFKNPLDRYNAIRQNLDGLISTTNYDNAQKLLAGAEADLAEWQNTGVVKNKLYGTNVSLYENSGTTPSDEYYTNIGMLPVKNPKEFEDAHGVPFTAGETVGYADPATGQPIYYVDYSNQIDTGNLNQYAPKYPGVITNNAANTTDVATAINAPASTASVSAPEEPSWLSNFVTSIVASYGVE